MRCCIPSCNANLQSAGLRGNLQTAVTSHRLPKSAMRKRLWIDSITLFGGGDITEDGNVDKMRVCSAHFLPADFYIINNTRRLHSHAFPSVFNNECCVEFVYDDPDSSASSSITANVKESKSTEVKECNSSNTEVKECNSSKQRIRYAGDLKDASLLSDVDRKRVVPKLQKQLHTAQKSIKRLRGQNYKLRMKNKSLEEVIESLKDKKLISKSAELVLQRFTGHAQLFDEICFGTTGRRFSDELKSFATTLHYYSAKAYRFVRRTFNNTLPHPRTIVKWYQSMDAEPGITSETLAALKAKAEDYKANGNTLLGCLLFDEMAIRQQVEWNPHSKKMEGTIHHAGLVHDKENSVLDELLPAREALVFMVSGVQEPWKIPVGYFLTAGLTASEKKDIVSTVLTSLSDVGVKIIALTFDGTSTNISMANLFGCNLKPNDTKNPFSTSFQHPTEDYPVFVILDACHMLKLVRNTLASQRILKSQHGEVRWEYIEKLNDLQTLRGLKLAGNLTNKHVQFENQKMKVNLAAQTLSNSVSKALSYLEAEDPSFLNCDPTARFVSFFNDIFDILNSMSANADGFKKPLNEDNFDSFKDVLNYAEEYIRSICLSNGNPILKSLQKTGYLGFLVTLKSIGQIFETYVLQEGVLDELFTYRLSQDHIEMFFGAIRAKGGSNNNPSAVHFKASYKRLMHFNSITASAKTNCVDFNATTTLLAQEKRIYREEYLNDNRQNDPAFEEVASRLEEQLPLALMQDNDDISTHTICQDAVEAQKLVLQKLKCALCIEVLTTDQTQFTTISSSLITICKVADHAFSALVNGKQNFNVQKYYDVLSSKILFTILTKYSNIFQPSPHFVNSVDDSEPESSHLTNLVKRIIEVYINIKITRYSKNIVPFKQSTRNKLNKLILFQGH